MGNVKEAVAEWKEAKLVYTRTEREVGLQVQQAYENWASAIKQARAYEKAVKTSEENFRLQKEDYTRNLVNNLDVLEALQTLLETKREYNQVYYEMKENYWGLQVAAGKCCGEIREPV